MGCEDQLSAVLVACLEALDQGQDVDRGTWLERYPQFAPELQRFFADQEKVDRLAAPLRSAVRDALGATPRPNFTPLPAGKQETGTDGPLAGGSFGDYELLQTLGEGGMGIVHKARQKSLQRVVALKRIRLSSLGSETEVQRFSREAEMVALLDHPHIVPIYEVGKHDGQPFFSMKWIDGGSLAGQLDRFVADPRSTARLMVAVARAVHHAHQRGILHRDLKPGNILLQNILTAEDTEERRGTAEVSHPLRTSASSAVNPFIPLITDFGLAKRVEVDSSLTESGMLVGTPSYMAPEQASGRKGAITTATDVYGLGAVLYALLTGRPPFRGDTALDTLTQVKEDEPEPPSKSNPRVDRDLETICLKSLEKEPERRYESAGAFAADVQRYLEGEPVYACPPSAGYRFKKFARRHKVALATAGLVAVALLVGTAVSMWQAIEANRARRLAEHNLALARQAVDEMYTEVAGKWLADQPHMTELQRQFLQKALQFYQGFARKAGTEPAVQLETARAYKRVGDIQAKLGDSSEAEAAYRAALRILEPLATEFPTLPQYRDELARSYNDLGKVVDGTGRHEEAETAYRAAVSISEPLATEFPTVLDYRQQLAKHHGNLGSVLVGMGKGAEAETAYRAALKIHKELAAKFLTGPEYRADLAALTCDLGTLLHAVGQAQDAERAYRGALKLYEQLAAELSPLPRYRKNHATSHQNMGNLLCEMGRPAEAEKNYRAALDILKSLAAEFPALPQYRESLAENHYGLATVLWRMGKTAEAEAEFRAALSIQERLAADFPATAPYRQHLACMHNDLGVQLVMLGSPAAAETSFRAALKVQEQLVADFPTVLDYAADLGRTYYFLGKLELEQTKGESAEGFEWLAKAIHTLSAVLAKDAHHVNARKFLCMTYRERIAALYNHRHYAEALPDIDRFIELLAEGAERDEFRARRAYAWFRTGRTAQAVAEADSLSQAKNLPGEALGIVAGIYALAFAALSEKSQQAENYAVKAIALLRRAQAAGFFQDPVRIAETKQATDFDTLRSRGDYQRLMQELEKKTHQKSK
jgi:serine/threonine protein kinase